MIATLDTINEIVKQLNKLIDGKNIIVLLQGDLASGKTTLVQHYIKSLGIEEQVNSPTFSVQSIYTNNIYHYDIYNKTLEEFIALGLLEEFEKDGVHFVEWGCENLKRILDEYGFEVLVIKINKLNEKREYIIGS